MEECVAAPVGRIDAATQIEPIADFMHRLVADDLLQHDRRRRPIDPAQHQEAAVEPGREQVDEIGVDRLEILATLQRVHQLLAHGDERRGPARREVEPPQQFLPARLGSGVKLGGRLIGRAALPRRDRRRDAVMIGTEPLCQRFEESDARTGGELGVARQDLARERDPGCLAASGQMEERVDRQNK